MTATPERGETTERISYRNKPSSKPGGSKPDGKPDDRKPDDRAGLDRDTAWIELADPTPASHGREFIVLGADAGTFTQLRIRAASGRPQVRTVRVDYQDGSHRVFQVDRVLDSRRGAAYVDLRGAHEIKLVVVVTDRASRGSYVVEGNTGETGVARR